MTEDNHFHNGRTGKVKKDRKKRSGAILVSEEKNIRKKMSKLEPLSPLSYTTVNPPRAEGLLLSCVQKSPGSPK